MQRLFSLSDIEEAFEWEQFKFKCFKYCCVLGGKYWRMANSNLSSDIAKHSKESNIFLIFIIKFFCKIYHNTQFCKKFKTPSFLYYPL